MISIRYLDLVVKGDEHEKVKNYINSIVSVFYYN